MTPKIKTDFMEEQREEEGREEEEENDEQMGDERAEEKNGNENNGNGKQRTVPMNTTEDPLKRFQVNKGH